MPVAAPPDPPPGLDARTTAYLRRLSVWAYGELQKKAPLNEAVPKVLVNASDNAKAVMEITANSSGAVSATQVPLGGGRP